MRHPANINLPFFAYGIFRPGQIGYFQIKDLVDQVIDPFQISGSLLIRDGLPIIDPAGYSDVKGALIQFIPDRAGEAYDRISALEPDNHYRWDIAKTDGQEANVLFGKSPRKGSIHCDEIDWNGWGDPLFTSALDVIEEILERNEEFNFDLKPMFRLQMAYLLLWSAIERYVSLRYHFGRRVTEKINHLTREESFVKGLFNYVNENREVYRSDHPDQKVILDRENPEKALNYYYQVRSNITHRGKGVERDHERVLKSLRELLLIFRGVLKQAQIDAQAQT